MTDTETDDLEFADLEEGSEYDDAIKTLANQIVEAVNEDLDSMADHPHYKEPDQMTQRDAIERHFDTVENDIFRAVHDHPGLNDV